MVGGHVESTKPVPVASELRMVIRKFSRRIAPDTPENRAMPEAPLSTPTRQALLALLLFGAEPATNNALYERFALKITKESREALEASKLITSWKNSRQGYLHALTERGRDRAFEELATSAPAGTGAGVRLLYALANVFHGAMAQHGIKAAQVFAGADDGPQDVEEQILAAYSQLAKRPGQLVSLVKLRWSLANVARDVMDKTLKAMDRQRLIQLDPDPNTKALPPEAHEAAIRIGGEDKHFITVGPQ